MSGRGEEVARPPHHKPWAVGTSGVTQRREEVSLLPEQQRDGNLMILCAPATRDLTYKKVKVETQVEQQSIRLGVFSTSTST
jgi:hypothetical protein